MGRAIFSHFYTEIVHHLTAAETFLSAALFLYRYNALYTVLYIATKQGNKNCVF